MRLARQRILSRIVPFYTFHTTNILRPLLHTPYFSRIMPVFAHVALAWNILRQPQERSTCFITRLQLPPPSTSLVLAVCSSKLLGWRKAPRRSAQPLRWTVVCMFSLRWCLSARSILQGHRGPKLKEFRRHLLLAQIHALRFFRALQKISHPPHDLFQAESS